MEKHDKHLNAEERGVILAEHQRGSSLRQIGRIVGRHHGTIGLELTRGATPDGYDPHVARLARDAAQLRSRRQRKLVPEAPFYDWVRNRLIHWCWSPEQIAARLRRMYPDDPSQRISHEAIYAAIYAQPRGSLKTLMIEALRQAKPKRGARRTTLAGSAMVPETLRIIYRPEDVEARLVPGHWPLGDASITCQLIGRKPDQGRFQPVGGGHGGRAQDALRHSQQDERLHRQRRP
jgi:IS30 family transposase